MSSLYSASKNSTESFRLVPFIQGQPSLLVTFQTLVLCLSTLSYVSGSLSVTYTRSTSCASVRSAIG
jgi:hypothetical protein